MTMTSEFSIIQKYLARNKNYNKYTLNVCIFNNNSELPDELNDIVLGHILQQCYL